MVTKKKSRGRDRKAKKEKIERAKVRNIWVGWTTGESTTISCNHGYSLSVSAMDDDHPVSRFLHDLIMYFENYNIEFTSVVEFIRDTLQTHPQVWNDESNKQIATNILTRMGTNTSLINQNKSSISWALRIAKTIHLLEHHDSGDSLEVTLNSQEVAAKRRDVGFITSSSRRDTLKFFSKRISCSCLKKMHQEARKTIPKTGRCYNCDEEQKRVALSVCSRCMISHYCSRECQVDDWPRHKNYCNCNGS